MDAADPREDDVARPQGVRDPVQLRLDLSREEEVGLLERVVMGLSRGTRFVIDREQRQQAGSHVTVHEHLHGDAAVGQERRIHAGGLAAAGGVPEGERLLLRGRAVVVADPAGRGCAEHRSLRERHQGGDIGLRRRVEGVGHGHGRWSSRRRVDRKPASLSLGAGEERVGDADGHQRIVTDHQPVRPAGRARG